MRPRVVLRSGLIVKLAARRCRMDGGRGRISQRARHSRMSFPVERAQKTGSGRVCNPAVARCFKLAIRTDSGLLLLLTTTGRETQAEKAKAEQAHGFAGSGTCALDRRIARCISGSVGGDGEPNRQVVQGSAGALKLH